jgi:sodium/hydrogen antiporter
MLATIVGVALVARVGLGLDTAVALLLGAVRAPTDPVLASAVSVNNAADHDRMRCGCAAATTIPPPQPISWP